MSSSLYKTRIFTAIFGVLLFNFFIFDVSLSLEFESVNSDIFSPITPLEKTPQPITRKFNLLLQRAYLDPDGFTRLVWTSNGQYPGPTIRINKGDRLVVNVTNNLTDPATIHWHGIFQRETNWFDGVAGQTQCPIPSGVSFVYNFTAGDQVGTYWWHSHYLAQYVDGLRGPLIIHDPDDPFLKEYDAEFILTLSDWYHRPSGELLPLRLTPGYSGFNPVPDAGLISGKGQYNCSAAPQGSKCNSTKTPAIYKVVKDKKYRFRIINTSGAAFFFFSIDNHPLTIIEVEGTYVKPYTVNTLPIFISQRYSVIVNANQPVDNYFIRATMARDCIFNSPTTINHDSAINYNVTGIFRYDGAPNATPKSQPYNDDFTKSLLPCRDLDQSYLKPYYPTPPPQDSTIQFEFQVTIRQDRENVTKAYINNQTFIPDLTSPSISKIMLGIDPKQFPVYQNAYVYDKESDVVDIVLLNQNGADHPFHLHGHNFWLIGSGTERVVNKTKYNLVDPILRDVTTVPGGGWAVIRYNVDNPGCWAFHCHIDWHVELGMVAQLIELPTKLADRVLPPEVRNLCLQYSKRVAIPGLAGDSLGLLKKNARRSGVLRRISGI
ncbi:162_t:CDS:2 [Acaulospora morrowiae]|uniref:162_t:CDS:1 n=1 Tax=Acaulospora morrowiae TaxID=94023 RepID=A0A9N8WQ04_9GLOM|nr:162_t:CDS:2 [Acaulospora morrowiae]